MDLKQLLAAAAKMFPSADLQGAAARAEQAISGTADTLEGVQSTARRLGIDPNIANSLYARYDTGGFTLRCQQDTRRRAKRLTGPAEGQSGAVHKIPPA